MKSTLRLWGLRAAGRRYPRGACAPAPRSVLLIRPDHLGDMLFLTPALRALRTALPDARLTVLCGPWSEAVLRGNPDVDAVETCRFPGFERGPKASLSGPYRYLATVAAQLRAGHYDAALILRFDHWWGAWLAAAAGIPCRIGYARPETAPFLTRALAYDSDLHEVDQNGRLAAALAPGLIRPLGPMRFAVSDSARAWAGAWLLGKGAGERQRLVAIHPGAGAAVKQWPIESWGAVANALAREQDAQIILTGAGSERELVAALATHLHRPALDAAGETTLEQLAALQERCALVLGSDSGPLHLAVAVGTPSVHLYGPVSVRKFGPWGQPGHHVALVSGWPCVPCNRLDWPASVLAEHACMQGILPAQVLAAARGLLAAS